MAEASSDNPLTAVILDSIQGKGYPVRDWLTSYPLIMVALDPYTHESAWILETAGQFLQHYTPADIRVAWLVASDDEGCREFLGPWANRFLTFADPDRSAIIGLGIDSLPALVHVRSDGYTQIANGWDPTAWRAVAEVLSTHLSWTRPLIPKPGDPVPYQGTPAAG